MTLNEEIYDYIVAAVKAWRARIAKHRLKRAQKLAQVGVRMRDADGVFYGPGDITNIEMSRVSGGRDLGNEEGLTQIFDNKGSSSDDSDED